MTSMRHGSAIITIKIYDFAGECRGDSAECHVRLQLEAAIERSANVEAGIGMNALLQAGKCAILGRNRRPDSEIVSES